MFQPDSLLYATTHEWVSVDDGIATVGISAFAVEQLNDLVFIDLPAVGKAVEAGKPFGEIESVKSVNDLYSPVTGEIVEVNQSLPDNLEWFNEEPYGSGWVAKIKVANPGELDSLMSYGDYQQQCSEEG